MIAPDEIVEVPGQPHTFALSNARDMLRKLEWEVAELARPDTDTVYRAFNAAVTAWHLTEWVWSDLSQNRRMVWQDSPVAFWEDCGKSCPDLLLCRLVAEASKHRVREGRRVKPAGVVTISLADVVRAKCGSAKCGEPLSTWTWRLIIREGDREHAAIEVFARALGFWREFIGREMPAN
jgi:hypothetical protein